MKWKWLFLPPPWTGQRPAGGGRPNRNMRDVHVVWVHSRVFEHKVVCSILHIWTRTRTDTNTNTNRPAGWSGNGSHLDCNLHSNLCEEFESSQWQSLKIPCLARIPLGKRRGVGANAGAGWAEPGLAAPQLSPLRRFPGKWARFSGKWARFSEKRARFSGEMGAFFWEMGPFPWGNGRVCLGEWARFLSGMGPFPAKTGPFPVGNGPISQPISCRQWAHFPTHFLPKMGPFPNPFPSKMGPFPNPFPAKKWVHFLPKMGPFPNPFPALNGPISQSISCQKWAHCPIHFLSKLGPFLLRIPCILKQVNAFFNTLLMFHVRIYVRRHVCLHVQNVQRAIALCLLFVFSTVLARVRWWVFMEFRYFSEKFSRKFTLSQHAVLPRV